MLVISLLLNYILAAALPKNIDRFFIIVLENTDFEDAIKEPYLGKTLTQRGRLLTNYKAILHPSQPNYITMVAGDELVTDNDVHNLQDSSIADLLEEGGKSWKTYQEGYPGGCFNGKSKGRYYRKHNPFQSFQSITSKSSRCANIANEKQLYADIESKSVPDYVFYTPDMDNDGHDTGVGYASKWLERVFDPIFQNPYFANTLFLVTFDEGSYNRDNRVYSLLLGNAVTPGSVDNTRYTHYSQLSFVEKLWGLGSLNKKDVGATPFQLE